MISKVTARSSIVRVERARLVAHRVAGGGHKQGNTAAIAQENTLARPVISQAFSEELVVARAECSGRMPQWARATPSSSTPSE